MNQTEQWSSIAVPTIVQRLWPGAAVYRTEDQQHPACKLLDTACGIDWLVEYRGLVKGLSVRCQAGWTYQYCLNRWNSPTFTIRNQRLGFNYIYESELEKTIEAERIGAITAAYQVHAYMDVDKGPATSVVGWGVARRVALFQWVKNNPDYCDSNSTQDEGRSQTQTFVSVPFRSLPNTVLLRAYPAIERGQGHDTLTTIAGPR